MASPGDRGPLVAFILSSVLAGGNAVCVRFTNRELAPLWGAGLRFALAAVLLLALMAIRRLAFPKGRELGGALLFGLLNFAGAFAFAYYALERLQAGFGQTVLALTPLATLLLAVAQRQERLRWASIAGAGIAVAGVAVISGPSLGHAVPVLSLLASLGAVLCFGEATVVARRFRSVHPITMNAVGMTAGAAVLILGAVVAGNAIEVPQRGATWAALAYLVPVGSVMVFVLFLYVVDHWGASRAAYGFVLIPPVTVVVSWWLLDEPVTWTLVIGGLLVLAGVYVGALRPAAAEAVKEGPATSP